MNQEPKNQDVNDILKAWKRNLKRQGIVYGGIDSEKEAKRIIQFTLKRVINR